MTAAMGQLLNSCLGGMRHVGVDLSSVLVIHTDGMAKDPLDLVASAGAELVALDDLIGGDACHDPGVYSDYGTQPFNELMLCRTIALRRLIERYDILMPVDLDVAWFRDPTAYVRKVLEIYPWTSQTEAITDLPCFCAGFFAFRDCAFSRDLLDEVIRRTRADDIKRGDQVYLNEILKEHPDRLRQVFPLPEALFPNGLLTQAVLGRNDTAPVAMTGRFDPFIYHANFTVGLDNKMILLERMGALDWPLTKQDHEG